MINCSFSTVHERDMDILFLEALVSDQGFTELVLSKTGFSGQAFLVLSVALSETEPDLGESDITIVLRIGDTRVGLLIEDKVDAIAMPDQHLRYRKRGERGVQKGKYDTFEIFIFCPEKYYASNSEAPKYEHYISYEKIKDYFDGKDDVISKVRSQQKLLSMRLPTYSSISTKPIRNSITPNWIYAPARSPMAGGHTFPLGLGMRTSITNVLKAL